MKQTGRKLTSWLLTLAMIVGLLPAMALPARAANSGNCGANGSNVTWQLNTGSTHYNKILIISGTGAMADYSNAASIPWYNDKQRIATVTINSGVTSIGDNAFYGCSSLTSVTIPSSVTSIGTSAFSGCSSLTSVTIPSSVTRIGRSAFNACTSLAGVTIPNSVTSIEDGAFRGCNKLNADNVDLSSVRFLGGGNGKLFSTTGSTTGGVTIKRVKDDATSGIYAGQLLYATKSDDAGDVLYRWTTSLGNTDYLSTYLGAYTGTDTYANSEISSGSYAAQGYAYAAARGSGAAATITCTAYKVVNKNQFQQVGTGSVYVAAATSGELANTLSGLNVLLLKNETVGLTIQQLLGRAGVIHIDDYCGLIGIANSVTSSNTAVAAVSGSGKDAKIQPKSHGVATISYGIWTGRDYPCAYHDYQYSASTPYSGTLGVCIIDAKATSASGDRITLSLSGLPAGSGAYTKCTINDANRTSKTLSGSSTDSVTFTGLKPGTTYKILIEVYDPSSLTGTHKAQATVAATTSNTVVPIASYTATTSFTYDGQQRTAVTGSNVNITGTNTATNVGSYTATVAPTSGSMWDDGTTAAKTVSWEINKAPLTVTADNKTITYGEAAPEYTITYSGWKGSDNENNAAGFTAPTIGCMYAQYGDVGSYDITLSDGSADNYTFTLNNGALTVDPKPVTVTGASAENKVYDGTTDATINVESSASIDGLVNEDEVTFSSATGKFADYNVGENKTVTVTGVTLGGDKAANYTVSPLPTATANIIKRPVTITAKPQSVELNADIEHGVEWAECKDELLPATDSLTAITLTPTDRNALTTTGTITPSAATIQNGGADATDNYKITYVNGNLTVTRAKPVVNTEMPTASPIIYGDALSQSTLTGGKMKDKYTGTEVPGTFSWETGTTVPDATQGSPASYTVRFTPDESHATLYEATTIKVPVTVAKRVVELNWGNNAFTYNSEAQKPVATVTNLVTDRGDTTETVAVTVTGEQTDSNAKAGNPAYTATASGLTGDRAANYTLEGTTNPTQTFTIAQKEITITAQDQTAQRGDDHADGNEDIKITNNGSAATTVETAISAAVTVETLADGDKLTSITLTGDTSAVTTGDERKVLKVSGAVIKDGDADVTGNYAITYVEANLLKVIPTRPKLVTAPEASAITYGYKLSQSVLTDTNAKMVDKRDSSKEITGTFTWKNGDIKPTVADSNSTKYTVVFTPTGEDADNYSPTEIEVTVTVNPAPLTVTAENKEMTYRTTVPALTYTVEGLVNNETASVALEGALTTTGSNTANVNTYDITQGNLTATANYTISTFNKGTLTIKKADQAAPSTKEGYTIADGKITVSTNKNTAANSETGYEVYEFSNVEDTTGTVKSSPVTIDAAKLYKIRWAGGDNYNPSLWTDIATTANVTVTISPSAAAGSVELTNDGKYPISASVTLNAAANANYQFASWQDSSGKTLGYNAAYTFTLDGDTALTAVFVDKDKTVVQLPVAAENLTYNGNEQTGVTAGAGCTLTNDKATNAGSYNATATLDEGDYIWADGTTAAKTLPWSIAKANQGLPDVTLAGSTFTAKPASGTVPQDPALVVYYTQDNTKPKSEWTPMPDGGIENAIGVYYFYTKGNNNYNDSEVATKSGGKPTVVSTLQPTGLATDGATLNGSVSDPDANIKASGVRVKYQWKRADATSWTEIETPTYTYESDKPFNATATLSGLTPDTEYLYRLVVTLKNDSELPGNTIRFRTPKTNPPSGSITVTVNSTPDPGVNVVVSVEEGNDVIASSECTTNASVTFSHLPDGFYNVVVRSKDGKYVETRMIAIQNGAGTATTFTIPAGKLATVVKIETADTPPVAVEGLNAMISTTEKTDAGNGNINVEVELDVEKKAQSDIPADERNALNAVVASGSKIDMYLDMSLFKTTTTLSGGNITGSTKVDIGGTNANVLEIAIPYADAKTKNVWVYRYHKNQAKALDKVDGKITTPTTTDDAKFYVDSANGYIFVYASGFSTYAIGTPKPAPAPAPAPAPTGGGGGWFPTPTPTPTPTPAKDITDPTVTGVADWLITDDHIVYLNGYEDDTIRPNSNITRAEVSMIFYRLLKNKDVTITKSFTDVPDGEWYSQAVGVLSNLGILRGYEDGDFRPQNPITRAEFTAIATRFAKATNGTASFLDVPENHWAYGNIATASDYGWVNGYGNGYFGPNGSITRAEAATIVNHMLGRAADQEWVLANPDKIKYFADLQDPRKWYYLDMVEASNEHDFTKDNGEEKWKK